MEKMIVLRRLGLGASLLVLVATATDAAAQVHAAGCFLSPVKLGDENISTFLASPASLNTIYPTGGFEMISRVRVLAGSSSETLDPMIGLIPQMTVPQKTALGSGLARTARACAAVDPTYAQVIQEKVAAANSPEVTAAFLSTLNEVQTAALGPAGAGAAGGALPESRAVRLATHPAGRLQTVPSLLRLEILPSVRDRVVSQRAV
ncbi:hypothetical protein [Rhizobium sp. RCAM05973]|uniref:hypothetical protein n=1 Tax=Rhizobium sp. RCAM05973 TaxID=2994066 RepID=UPI0022EBF3FE|nr:hypothetical protein [Rhizobium sp. RCAM05973]